LINTYTDMHIWHVYQIIIYIRARLFLKMGSFILQKT